MATREGITEVIARNGGLTQDEATRVFNYYVSPIVKAIKPTAHDGFVVTHGGFLDAQLIHAALKSITVIQRNWLQEG